MINHSQARVFDYQEKCSAETKDSALGLGRMVHDLKLTFSIPTCLIEIEKH